MQINKKIVLLLWVLSVSIGMGSMFWYSLTPGEHVVPEGRFPANSGLGFVKKKPNLYVFLHPKCSCSEATVSELLKMVPELKEVKITVLFNSPSADAEFVKGSLWDRVNGAEAIEAKVDAGGKITKLFDVKTSGQALLYDEDENLIFSGGLTSSRGHEGDSMGKDFILKWVTHREKKSFISDIFGCGQFKG